MQPSRKAAEASSPRCKPWVEVLHGAKDELRPGDKDKLRSQEKPGQSVRAMIFQPYSATASFSITTFKCAVTSLCSLTGTVNSPKVFNGSCSWILRRSMLKPFLVSASPMSLDVTEPKS